MSEALFGMWTQAGTEPRNHYGHKNVVLGEQDEEKVPTHPVAADNPDLGPRRFNTPCLQHRVRGRYASQHAPTPGRGRAKGGARALSPKTR